MKRKKIVSVLLALVMIVSLMPMMTLSVSAGAVADYRISGNPGDYQVDGNGSYATLNAALAVCTNAGGDSVLTIQFGISGSDFVVKEILTSDTSQSLISATYIGSVTIMRDAKLSSGSTSYGLGIPTGVTAFFSGLTVEDSGSSYTELSAIYVSGGSLMVKSGTSITVNDSNDRAINAVSGSVTVEDGTITAANTNGSGIALFCNGTASTVISGGTIETCGNNGFALGQFSAGTVTVSGGTIKASSSGDDENGGIGIGANSGKTTISGGTISAAGSKMMAGAILMSDATNSVLEISGSADITGVSSAVTISTKSLSKNGTVNITGGTLTATGSNSIGILNMMGTVNVSGGRISSLGTGEMSCAILCASGMSTFPAQLNISNTSELSSAISKSIFLYNMSETGATDPDSLSASIFGKTVYGSNKANVIISGTGSNPYVFNSTNYTEAKVSAENLQAGSTFTNWTSDSVRSNVISTTNTDTLSNLTTGPNSSVTSIYLNTNTVVDADYVITGGPASYSVSGDKDTYSTLADALKVCSNKGTDGVLTIQLGTSSTSLKVNEQSQSGNINMLKNGLKAATYSGNVEIQDTITDAGFGLVIPNTGVIFDGLAVSANVNSSTTFYAVYVMSSATLAVKGTTSINTSSDNTNGILNRGTFTMSNGQISTTGSISFGLENSTNKSIATISGGTFTGSGVNSKCLLNEGTLTISDGTFTGSGNDFRSIMNLNSDSGEGQLTVSGGTFSVEGQKSIIINNAAKMSVTGGSFTAGNGTAQQSICIANSSSQSSNSTISGGSFISNDPIGYGVGNRRFLTISGTPEIVSAFGNNIYLRMGANTTLLGKTIHASNDCEILVKGAAAGSSFNITPSNYSNSSLIAFNFLTGKSFAAWTSDSAFANSISTTNGDTISKLTTGANASVSDIYLKTGTEKAVVLTSGSLGKAGDGTITALSAGTKYKVIVGSNTYYVKADGTLSANASDIAELTGTEITGLSNGTSYLVSVYSTGGGAPAGPPNSPSPSSNNDNSSVVVNGKTQNAGKVETTTSGGSKKTTVTMTSEDLKDILDKSGKGTTIEVPVKTGADTTVGRLDGKAVKEMENKEATLVIQTNSAMYTLPASQINIDAVSQQFGTNVSLGDITVDVSISEPSDTMVTVTKNSAEDGGFAIVVPAVEFTVSCTYNGQTTEVSTFNSYVERMVAIPDGVDPNKITTGIVVKPDGSTRHVPTEIIVINGKYYAKINSLTNSVYSVIWNPIEFSDVENHWAKNAINNMGSRMIVTGVGNNKYEPARNITRAEFASIIVRALGLEPGTGTSSFKDVDQAAWYCGYIKTAASYGIINGYSKDTFGPKDTITREQAMTMIANAMKTTGLKVSMTDSEITKLLGTYSDGAFTSDYAEGNIAVCVKAGIISGTGTNTISPKSYVTRAEVAVMVERLLQKSKLI